LFERVRSAYEALLTKLVLSRKVFVALFLCACLCALLLVPFLGQDFFPNTDSGEFILHVRARTGTRIEETARLSDQIEASIRREIPGKELNNILDNLGLPYSPMNTMHSTSGIVGAEDGDIMVSLNENHHPTANYVRELRRELPREFPGTHFYFLPADITTQVLNFGLPAPTSSLHRLPPTAGRNCWPRMRSHNRKPIRPQATSTLASLCCRRLRLMCGD
jgi:multidrug efflux pump subunit AcrB